MTNKIFLTFIIVVLWIFASVWCFNHVNAWIGIAVFILGLYISAKQIFKPSKKTEEKMRKLVVLVLAVVAFGVLTSCERVAPNYYGVLMENYGKDGKSDYTKVQGRVSTMSPGTELFEVPAWEQRGKFTDDNGEDRVLQIKAADNTAFTSKPLYSYKVIENRVVDVVFQNARLGSGSDFMNALQDNVLEPRIYDIIKEASRSYTTDALMANGGSLKFEQYVQGIVKAEFDKSGLELISFSLNLDFSKKVKKRLIVVMR